VFSLSFTLLNNCAKFGYSVVLSKAVYIIFILTCFISIGHFTDIGSSKCIYVNANFTQQSPSREAKRYLIWTRNLTVHHRVYKSLTMVPISSHLITIHLNNILPSTLKPQKMVYLIEIFVTNVRRFKSHTHLTLLRMFYYLSPGLGLRYRLASGHYTRTWMHTETQYLVLYAFMSL
jgi:hypothetical protein